MSSRRKGIQMIRKLAVYLWGAITLVLTILFVSSASAQSGDVAATPWITEALVVKLLAVAFAGGGIIAMVRYMLVQQDGMNKRIDEFQKVLYGDGRSGGGLVGQVGDLEIHAKNTEIHNPRSAVVAEEVCWKRRDHCEKNLAPVVKTAVLEALTGQLAPVIRAVVLEIWDAQLPGVLKAAIEAAREERKAGQA